MSKLKSEILYRISKSRDGRVRSQVVVPEELREKVLRLAHEGVMSGHQGITKTTDRGQQNFRYPGVSAEIIRYATYVSKLFQKGE
jgi:Integrase zinc binding domain